MKEHRILDDKISVLYVDDEPDLLEIGKLFLEKSYQIHVDTVTSAPEALQILQSTSYDAIVSDYQMPGMDGIAFLKAIRAEFPDLPFIIFTGKGREDVVIEAFNYGADSYLQKGGEPTPQFFELGHKITGAVRRRHAEKALQESEIRYRNVVEDQTEFISRFLPDGTHVFVNEAYCRYFNKKREEILGKKFKPDIPQEDQSRVKEHFLSLTKEHPVAVIDHRIVMPDGGIRWQQWNDRAIFNDNGTLIEFQSVGRDITERKHSEEELRIKNDELHAAYEQIIATEEELRHNYNELDKKEQKLRESEENYRSLAEASHDLIFMIDPDDYVTYVNSYAASVFGKTASAIIGKTRSSLFSSEMSHRQEEPLRHVFRTGTPFRSEGRMMVSGEFRWFDHFLMPVKDKDCKVQSVVGVSRDITDRKRVEEEITFKNIIQMTQQETSLDGILIVDENGKILDYNQKFIEIFGIPNDLMASRIEEPVLQFGIGQLADPEAILSRVRYLYHHKEEKSFDEILLKDGRVLERFSAPMLGDKGKYYGRVWYFRDITERKQAEDALRQANRKLTLLSGITRHDINNQITMLTGFLRVLEKKQPDPAFSEYFQKISTTAKRISSMIRFTKEYEKIGIRSPVWQDIRILVETAVKEVQLGNVSVKNDLPAGTEMFADQLIVKVFYNLVDNAVRYGGKITTIRFTVQESGDDHLIVCEDDGEGIPAEEKEKIFDRGFGKNNGIGLFLAREILSITDIIIQETGEPGKGARFEITVPKGAYRLADGQ